ncbi:drug/metabolite transporter (DMT)-like permease [Bosea sp. BE271]|uniref:hypothetical protein n=1 Tax=Bosea TaxID=85413 RepID=UPI00285F8AC5|nr:MULTISPECIES: hypothetical protein [Bosea]MDR6828218.1 drug/metabolite transporter (DMT)-like permease [Bosea robiniae]MDR6897810.1 drug/metabolite transporter (DMT)-like permease [Bosea sp. BE109]MDR7141217.1 drug/metabolite transporter (DMT)-like permease [Bosea sp. BE168]MDR7177879.1 drug/metabolite transporter (DMT)-like permease [Bosea sp. BE271]
MPRGIAPLLEAVRRVGGTTSPAATGASGSMVGVPRATREFGCAVALAASGAEAEPGLRPSAIGFRGGIQALPEGSFLIRASTILVLGLGLQTLLLVVYMLIADRQALILSLRSWRRSLSAGFLGAAASQFWFIGFSLTTAANVRTLALIEVPLAQIASRKLFAEGTSRREMLGMAMIVGGVGLLLSLALQ